MSEPTTRQQLDAIAAAARVGGRRGAGSVTPIGARGQKTRDELLRSAHRLFGEQGYQGTTVAQIAEAAGVSLGTFYQYFSDRQAIVAELVGQWVERLMTDTEHLWRVRDGRAGLERMLTRYVTLVAQDIRFWRAWDEVCHQDERLARVRRDVDRLLVESVERELARGQRAGLVRAELEPAATARALTGMVQRFLYTTYYFDPPDPLPTPEQAAATLTDLWVGAMGLENA